MKKIFCVLGLCISVLACKQEQKNKDCPTGKPLPIFNKDIHIVKNHSFTSTGQSSTEEVNLSNQIHLEIYQQGCDTLFQSFRFRYPTKIAQDSFVVVIDSAVNQFKFLSGSDQKLKPFSLWSDALTQIRPHAIQGEYLALGQGINLKIDKLEQEKGTTILIDVMQIVSTSK